MDQQLGTGAIPVQFTQPPPPASIVAKTITFTEAQLKAALTGAGTFIQLLPAPGANTFYEVIFLAYSLNWSAAPAGTVNLTVRWGTAFVSTIATFTNWFQGAVTGRRAGSMSVTSYNLTPVQTGQIANAALNLYADAAIPGGATLTGGGFKVDVIDKIHALA